MTKQQQNNLWTVLGVTSVILAINFWIASQGGRVNFNSPVQMGEINHSASIFGLFFVIFTYLLFLYTTLVLLSSKKRKRLKRLPHPFNLKIQFKNKKTRNLNKLILILTVIIFMVIPMASIIHLENKMLKGVVVINSSALKKLKQNGLYNENICLSVKNNYPCAIAVNWKTHLLRTEIGALVLSGNYRNDFRYDPKNCSKKTCEIKGLTFFPFIQPWLYVLLGLATFILWSSVLWKMIRSNKITFEQHSKVIK